MQGVALDVSMCEQTQNSSLALKCCIQPYAIFPKCKLEIAVNYRTFSQLPHFPLYSAPQNLKAGTSQPCAWFAAEGSRAGAVCGGSFRARVFPG